MIFTGKGGKRMKKCSVLIAALVLSICMTGCGKAGKEPEKEEEKDVSTQNTENGDPFAPLNKNDEEGPEDKEENKEADIEDETPEIKIDYPFSERFVYGDKNLFYIEDDGTLSCQFRSDDESTIECGMGDDERYYFIVNNRNGQTLYFLDHDFVLSQTTVEYPESMFVNCITPHDGKLFYSGYESAAQKYSIFFYDPEGDAFSNDPEIDKLDRQLQNYKGRGLSRIFTVQDIVRDMETTGCIYMFDGDSKEVYVFDEDGNEENVFKTSEEEGNFQYFEPGYIIKEIYDYSDDVPSADGRCGFILYDVKDGKDYDIPMKKKAGDTGICTVKDGYLYFYENVYDNDLITQRQYKRISIDSIKAAENDVETVLTVAQYPKVSSYYGNYSEGSTNYDGFTVKSDRIWYLAYDENGDNAKKGDVAWESIALDHPKAKPLKTGAIERHEDFSDFGFITQRAEKKLTDDGFDYFSGMYQSFRFYDDIDNAEKMNGVLADVEKTFKDVGKDTEDSAYNDVVKGDELEWFKETIGHGYSYDQTFDNVKNVGKKHVQVSYSDYAYYGGAHGGGSSYYVLFDKTTGKRQKLKDLYKGSEDDSKKVALSYSMDDWRNNSEAYYYNIDSGKDAEQTMKENFEECISIDMLMSFDEDGVYICYPPYAVGPYASGQIDVLIPWYALDIEYSEI